MKSNATTIILTSMLLGPVLAQAGELEQQLQRCAVLGDASARLGCFDALSKAAEVVTIAAGGDSNAVGPVAPGAIKAAVAGEAAAKADPGHIPEIASATKTPPESPISRTVQRWELDDASKRGVFAFRPHRDNYLLLANYSTSSNNTPYKDITPAGIEAKHVELTYQLSFKMKMLEEIAGSPIDLWFGYTQQSFWQAYNRAASSPFRETNYQPEVMAVLPINKNFAGLDFRYLNLGLVHQSNGQTSTLSRSWNRVYAELGVDRGDFALAARLWKRLDNAKSDNDNIDITDFLGHGDLRVAYRWNGSEFSVIGRRNFSTRHGSLQAGWAFPVVANLKGYVQLFSGYGQSLIDYNYSQKSLGAGFTVEF